MQMLPLQGPGDLALHSSWARTLVFLRLHSHLLCRREGSNDYVTAGPKACTNQFPDQYSGVYRSSCLQLPTILRQVPSAAEMAADCMSDWMLVTAYRTIGGPVAPGTVPVTRAGLWGADAGLPKVAAGQLLAFDCSITADVHVLVHISLMQLSTYQGQCVSYKKAHHSSPLAA